LFSSRPAEALAERLADLAPIADARVFFTPGGGSDAIDTAAKLARAYWHAIDRPHKQLIIARQHAYHGMNAYGTSLGGIPANTDPFGPLVTLVEHVAWDDAHALAKVIDQVGADRVAAFFCEPVIGAGGVYFPPDLSERGTADLPGEGRAVGRRRGHHRVRADRTFPAAGAGVSTKSARTLDASQIMATAADHGPDARCLVWQVSPHR
jgi:Aminotransferase class-III